MKNMRGWGDRRQRRMSKIIIDKDEKKGSWVTGNKNFGNFGCLLRKNTVRENGNHP